MNPWLRHFSDMATHRLIKVAGVAGGVPGAIGSRLALNWLEYWRDEAPLLAKKADVAQWQADVRAVAAQLAALEARLQQLEKHS